MTKIFKTKTHPIPRNKGAVVGEYAITLDDGETLWGGLSKKQLEDALIEREHKTFKKTIYDY